MNKKIDIKKEWVLIVASSIFFVFGIFIGSRVFNSTTPQEEVPNQNQDIEIGEEADDLPDEMIEARLLAVYLDEGYISVDVRKPSEFNGVRKDIKLNPETRFKELELEVRGLDDIQDRGVNEISMGEIREGDDLLISLQSDAEDIFNNEDKAEALIVTKITEI